MAITFGPEQQIETEERKRIRLRFWLGFVAQVALTAFVVTPVMRRMLGNFVPSGAITAIACSIMVFVWLTLAPSVAQETRRRSKLRLIVDEDSYTFVRGIGHPLVLDRAEVREAQRTPRGGLWLVTRLPRRRIALPRQFPDLAGLRALLRERGVPERPAGHWMLTYFLPALGLYGAATLAVFVVIYSTHARLIEAAWLVIAMLFGFQMYRARQDRAFEADGAVTLLIVGIVVAGLVAALRALSLHR